MDITTRFGRVILGSNPGRCTNMTLPTHALLGLAIGQITHQPLLGISFAIIPDIDHLYSYVKHRYYKDWNIFYKNAFGKHDFYQDQRNILHNVVVYGILVIFSYIFYPSITLTLSISYLSHILLDALDSSDYYPLYPIKILNIRGPIDFYSKSEFVVLLGLVCLNFYLYFIWV